MALLANQHQIATVALVLGGDTIAAAGSSLVATTRLSASAPTDTPGRDLLAIPPQDATAALASGSNTTDATRSLLAVATCLSMSALTDSQGMVPLENPPPVSTNANTTCAVGCSSNCSNGHVGLFVLVAILVATAPLAVANPSWTLPAIVAATTQGGWIGGAGSVAVGGPLAAGGATGAGSSAMVEGGDLADRAQASIKEQHVANSWLCSVYRDTIHQNVGTHHDGGIGVVEDAKWQRLYLWLAACQLLLRYDLPNGQWANWFVEILMGL
jgi:hypothetical protein